MYLLRYFLLFFLSLFILSDAAVAAPFDCNNNGIDDATDIELGTSEDCNGNGIPDECDVSASGFTFREFKELELKSVMLSGFPNQLVPTKVADFNGDGHPDLWGMFSYTTFGGHYIIFIYLNQGDNTFTAPIEIPFTGTTGFINISISDPVAIDIDSDGDLDIVFRHDTVAWRHNPPSAGFLVSVLENDGEGNFTRKETNIPSLLPPRSATSTLPSKLVATSFAHVNSKDLAMIHEGRVYALYNIGNLEFVHFDMGASGQADNLGFFPERFPGSVNMSQTRIFSSTSDEGFLMGPGDGSLQRFTHGEDIGFSDIKQVVSPENYTAAHLMKGTPANPGNKGYSTIMTQPFSGGGRKTFPAGVGSVQELFIADFNGDGASDVVFFGAGDIHSKSGIQILLNEEPNDFSNRLNIFMPPSAKQAITVFDFDNDGKPDILFKAKEEGKMLIGFNGTTYPLTPALEADLDANYIPDICERTVPGDFNGDRKGDRVVVRNYSGQLLWLISPDSFTYVTSPTTNIPFGLAGDTLLAGDFNGQGKISPGVIRKNGDYLDWYWLKSDDSTAVISYGLRNDTPLSGYFNADKTLDRVVVRDHLGGLLWLINTDGESHSVHSMYQFGLTGDTPFTADMDGDGISELIVSRTLSSGQVVWYALFINSQEVLGPYPWGLRGDLLMPPTDFDGSGRAQYLVARPINGFLNTFHNSPLRENYNVYTDVQKLFGLPGDHLHVAYRLGLPYGHLSVWRPSNYFWNDGLQFSQFWDSIGESLFPSTYGFTGDVLIGIDGKAVGRYDGR